ncbi:MAG: DNA primase [Gemmatimonadaceae bacterium]
MIPDEVVERVREAADIVEVIGEHVRLKRVGADFRGPCPFHQGSNPNFSVSQRKGIYHCYKCGVSGDVFTFLREHLGLDFVDSVRQLGDRFGVVVQEVETRGPRVRDEREPLWETLGAATEYFRDLLWSDPAAEQARAYLAERAVSREIADSFDLGFAPRDGDALRRHLNALGFSDERQVEVGLLARRDGGSIGPRFRGRLMIPIADIGRHPVGFGGRILGPGEPKYLNSPETKVFVKSRLLYNLDRAKQSLRKEDRVLVVEGYFDVLRLVSAGIDPVVAPMGTALAEAQAALLARYTKNAFLLYDSDEAGLKATFRSGLELLRHGVAVRVVTLPDGEDPDSFVARHGAERLERHVSAAMDLFERQVQILERHGWFAELHRKRRAVDKLLPTIRAAADPVTRELYLARLSELTGVDRGALQREVDAPSASRDRPASDPATASRGPSAPPEGRRRDLPDAPSSANPPGGWRARGGGRGKGGRGRGGRWWRQDAPEEFIDSSTPRPGDYPMRGAERSLVLAMLHREGFIASISEQARPESFRDPRYAEIFALLVQRGEAGDPTELADALTPESVAELQRLLGASEELTVPHVIVQDSLAKLRYFELSEQIDEVQQLLARAAGDRRTALEAERTRLADERKSLGVRGNWARTLGT